MKLTKSHLLSIAGISLISSIAALPSFANPTGLTTLAQATATTPAMTAQTTMKPKLEKHPGLRKALRQLKAARTSLAAAAHDFGGERMEALQDTDKAIKDVQDALQKDKY